jgi:phosphoglycerate dehydrogenase-like enzyme
MKYVLSVLDITAEEVKNVIDRELGAIYDIKYASSYDRREQLDLAAEADFIWVGSPSVDAEMIDKAPKLKIIHKCGIGVDKIDLEAARAKGVKVYITGGVNAIPVAEMTLMLIMAVLRRFVYADVNLRKGKWLSAEIRGVSQHLTGKTVGIVGMGNIGRNFAKLLKGFECKVYYYDVCRPSPAVESALGITYSSLGELLKNSEVISLHIPLTPETENMINRETLAMMNKNAILVNTARGGLIDEKALVEALQKETIAGAGLDVFEMEPVDPRSPLLAMDNVVLSPHLAGSTINNLPVRAKHIARNLDAFLCGGEIAQSDRIVG